MRLVSFEDAHGLVRAGVWVDSDRGVVPTERLHPAVRTMLDVIEGGPELLARLADALPGAEAIPTTALRLLAPPPEPPQLRDCMAFEQHLQGCLDQMRRMEAARRGVAPEALADEPRFAI